MILMNIEAVHFSHIVCLAVCLFGIFVKVEEVKIYYD